MNNKTIEKIKECLPDMSNEEIEKFVGFALNEDHIIQIIVNYICYKKEDRFREYENEDRKEVDKPIENLIIKVEKMI